LGSILLFILFLADGSIFVTYPVLFVTIIPLSVVGASSFSMALAKHGHNAGSASAFLGFSQLLLGGAIMPLVGIAGDDTPIPMVVLMIAGYGLAIWCYYKRIAPEHYHER
jgi:DHA1 family bicyclomycin/chloramphenicol resistance-like MFS transporter